MTGPSNFKMDDRRGMRQFAIALGLASRASLLLVDPPRSLAQEFRATLTGTVTDATGAVVPKAEVTAPTSIPDRPTRRRPATPAFITFPMSSPALTR